MGVDNGKTGESSLQKSLKIFHCWGPILLNRNKSKVVWVTDKLLITHSQVSNSGTIGCNTI